MMRVSFAHVVVDAPTPEQYHGSRLPTVDLTRGPELPCPQRLQVNLYRCIDLWVDGNGGPHRTPCSGCPVGRQRRAGIAPALDAPEMVDPPRKPKQRRLWSDADLARAISLYQQGMTLLEAEKQTGVPTATLRKHMRQQGQSCRPLGPRSEEQREAAAALARTLLRAERGR